MGIEVAGFISELVDTNPTGADNYSTADDHIRLVKNVLKAQFPNFTAAAMNATIAELNKLAGLATTAAELAFVNGVTSAIQTQIDGKAASVHVHSAADVTSGLLAIARGGTNAATEAAARTNLGVVPGTDVQAFDAGLLSIAGLTTVADRMIYATASDVYAVTPLTAFARTLLDDASAAAARTTLGLVIGTNVQAQDAGLQSIAALATLADRMIYTTALDTYAVATLTSFARTLLDDANAATARGTLGLGSLATLSTVNNAQWSGTDLTIANGGTNASDVVTAQRNLQIFTGHVNSLGTIITGGPAGWTVSKLATGRYRITHNLALSPTTDLRIVGLNAVQPTNSRGMWVEAYATNTFDVICQTFGGTGTDDEFFFLAIQI